MIESNYRSPPPSGRSLLESRASLDWLTLPFRMAQLRVLQPENIGQGRQVCLLPGFGTGENSMQPLQFFLEKHGYKVFGWGLGVNKAGLDRKHDPKKISWPIDRTRRFKGETGVPHLCDLMVQRIQEIHEESGEKIALVGWSLGGSIAREVARDLPDIVNNVVTLGSPLIGGPKYTAAASFLKSRGLDLDWIEREVDKRNQTPIRCKATAIVSRSDGVVDISASVIPDDQDTDYIEIDVSHLGMGVNGKVMQGVLSALR